jgi:hypothetical protein
MTFGDRFYSVAELADVTGYHRDSIYPARSRAARSRRRSHAASG